MFIVGVYGKTLEMMRAIHPDADRVFVVTGLPNNGGQARENIIRKELAPFERELTITYLTDLTTSALVDTLSHAPPRSLVLYRFGVPRIRRTARWTRSRPRRCLLVSRRCQCQA